MHRPINKKALIATGVSGSVLGAVAVVFGPAGIFFTFFGVLILSLMYLVFSFVFDD